MFIVQFINSSGEKCVGVRLTVDSPLADVSAATSRRIKSTRDLLVDDYVAGITLCKRILNDGSHFIRNEREHIQKFLAPIDSCDKVLCVGMNYVDHCTEQNQPVPKEPLIFSKFASSIVADGDNIELSETEELDWEVELVVVIGNKCRNVTAESAMSYIAGYTIAHDVSARDWQLKRNGGQWLLGKSRDTFCPLGPAIITKEAVSDVHNLSIECVVNGEVKQSSNTNQLVHKCHEVVAFVSRFMTLLPGDIILTGTPPGVGIFKKPPQFLMKGDVVTCRIEQIGQITNTVV